MSDPHDSTTPEARSERPVVPVAPDAALLEAVSGGVTWVPFALYLGAWIALSAACAFLLGGATTETPARWLPGYPALLWTGVALTAAGPVLSIAVWLDARGRRSADARRGLLAAAMTRGALAAGFGVVIWLGTLYLIEIMTLNGVLR